MVDTLLFASLLDAIPAGTRLILVGDPNQLPSIGPGSVLRDLVASGVPVAALSQIQRNAGRIVRACHSILAGDTPEPSPKLDLDGAPPENWLHFEIGDPAEIGKFIVQLHESAKAKKRFDPSWDIQVISPEKRKPGVGTNDLNRRLGDILNPYRAMDPSPLTEDDCGKEPEFKRGDKVIRVKNGLADMMTPTEDDDGDKTVINWDDALYFVSETDIVNGDMGTIRDIYEDRKRMYVIVQFRNPDKLCRLPYAECHLSPAYAVTCHKAQGSGFKYVIIPVHDSFYYDARSGQGLWNREMVYTLLSRAEMIAVTVGQMSAIRSAVGRKTVERRRTRLQSLVSSSFASQVDVAVAARKDLASVEA
jgi:exodeoxyribonuclease V alpha subunit